MNKILFVVVIYKQNYYNSNTYKTLLSHNKNYKVFLYDNSPTPQHSNNEFECCNVKYISNTDNPGLSHAYNQAAKFALENNFKWILLLDQDTYFSPNIVDDYLTSIQKHSDIKLIVPQIMRGGNLPMSPILNRNFFNCKSISIRDVILSSKKYSAINSGMCINIDAFFEVDGYDEEVTLDFSDMQFFERFSRKYDTFYVMNSICIQEFSNDVQSFSQKLTRYGIFCTCLKNCKKNGWRSKFSYDVLVAKRALSLCIRNLSVKPILIMFNKYFNL